MAMLGQEFFDRNAEFFKNNGYDIDTAEYLKNKGFLPEEYLQLVEHQSRDGNQIGYKRSDFNFSRKTYKAGGNTGIAYLAYMVNQRQLYVAHQKYLGKTQEQIEENIRFLYHTKKWYNRKGEPDVWAFLKINRDTAIMNGDYDEPKNRSHHTKTQSSGNKAHQRSNAAYRKSGGLLHDQFIHAKYQLQHEDVKPLSDDERARLNDFVKGNAWRYEN